MCFCIKHTTVATKSMTRQYDSQRCRDVSTRCAVQTQSRWSTEAAVNAMVPPDQLATHASNRQAPTSQHYHFSSSSEIPILQILAATCALTSTALCTVLHTKQRMWIAAVTQTARNRERAIMDEKKLQDSNLEPKYTHSENAGTKFDARNACRQLTSDYWQKKDHNNSIAPHYWQHTHANVNQFL